MLEIFFRTVIPASDPPESFFDETENMYYYNNEKESGVITIGKFAEIRSRWRINNMHWNYPIDYKTKSNNNLIAVIGDSYIEAFQVDVDKNYPYLLQEKLKPVYEVYAFGKQGAPLSQYLHISRYVNKHFNPDILIFNLVHNDFDESIEELNPSDYYFLLLSLNKDSTFTETVPHPNYNFRQYSYWKKVIFRSALFRYIQINLAIDVKDILSNLFNNDTVRYEANTSVEKIQKNKELIIKSTNYLVSKIKNENIGKRIIFVMDAPRYNIYDNNLESSQVLWLNEMTKNICSKNDIEFIDLTPLMNEDYKVNKSKFNSDLNAHWNEYGHEFVSNIVLKHLLHQNNEKVN